MSSSETRKDKTVSDMTPLAHSDWEAHMTALIIILILFAAFCILSWQLARYAAHGERYSLEETFKDQCGQNPEVEALSKVKTTSYRVINDAGYVLHTTFYPNDDQTNKYLIMVHGYTLNRNGELKYMPIFRRLGYNCIVYDHRGHGENAWKPCSFGIEEAKDLMAIIRDTYERYGKDIYLGLTGESLGAGTEITALQYHPDVKFIVNDCGFADIIPVEKDGLYGLKLPRWLVYPASCAAAVLYGHSFTEAKPIRSLKDNRIPICFIHGEEDTFIRPEHSVKMHEANPAYSELHLIPGAEHAKSINTDPKGYEEIVDRFVRGVENGTLG